MDGYDMQEAIPRIAKALRRAGAREADGELHAWIRRAIDADMAYMREAGVPDGGEYDEDEACEAVMAALEEDGMDDEAMQALLMRLDAFMEAETAYLCEIGIL